MFRSSPVKNHNCAPYKTLSKETRPQRTLAPTNQIYITDFAFTEPSNNRKKKRCPLWLINKNYKNKNIRQGNIFTSQGIVAQSPQQPLYPDPRFRYENKLKSKRLDSHRKKNHSLPFNFIKSKDQHSELSALNKADQQISTNFRHVHSRGLYSSLSQRRNRQGRSPKCMANSFSKITKIQRYEWKNDLAGWNTIDLEYE